MSGDKEKARLVQVRVLRTTLLCFLFCLSRAFGQATPVVTLVTNSALPTLDITPASIHLAPRSFGTIFGSNLADNAGSTAPVTSFGGTEVHLASDTCFDSSCDLVALLTYASPAQINFIVPDDGSATCTTCTPVGYRIVFVRSGQRFDNRAYGSGGPGRVFIDPTDAGDNNIVFSLGYDCFFSYSLSDPSACGLSSSAGFHRALLGAMTEAVSGKLISSNNPVHQGELITLWMTALYGGVRLDSNTGLLSQPNPAPVGFGVAQFGQDMALTVKAGAHGPTGAFMTPVPLWAGEQPQIIALDQINVSFPTCTNVPAATVESRYDAFLTYTNIESHVTARVYIPFVVRPGDPDCHWLFTSTTTISSDINPSVGGQTVTFTAVVSPPGATGNVSFFDGSNPLGTSALTSSNLATFSSAGLSAGTHSIAAVYNGSAIYQASSAVMVQAVKANTTTVISSNANPSAFGHLTFTAAVSPADATGTVIFYDGLQVMGKVPVNNGIATLGGGALPIGVHSVLAQYSGDQGHQESSGTITQTVAQGTPSILLTSSATSLKPGDSVVVTATLCCYVTGTVTFFDGNSEAGTANVGFDLPVSGGSSSTGRASFTISSLSSGTHHITARYNGDSNNKSAVSSGLDVVVTQITTSITLSSNINPATYGQVVTLTAVVSAKSPSGNIAFYDGSSPLGVTVLGPAVPVSGGISSGTATITVALAVGLHYLTAAYDGDVNNAPAISAVFTEVVNPLTNTSITLSSNINPSLSGQIVTLTAVLSAQSATGPLRFMTAARHWASAYLVPEFRSVGDLPQRRRHSMCCSLLERTR